MAKSRRPYIKVTEIEAALKRRAGILAHAADDLGMSRSELARRVSGSKRLRAVCVDADEALNDASEANVARDILAGNVASSRWRLDRKARHRGYGRTVEGKLDAGQFRALLLFATGGDVSKLDALEAELKARL